VLGADPGLLASFGLAERKHLVDQTSGDPLSLRARRDTDLVDVKLRRLVRMPVDHRRALAHHDAVGDRHEHEMAGCRQISDEPVAIDRLVKDIVGYVIEERRVSGCQPFDRDIHNRSPRDLR
jgi:hypothetical protein